MKHIMWAVVWISGVAASFASGTVANPILRMGIIIALAAVSTILFNTLLHDYVLQRIEVVTQEWVAERLTELDRESDETE